MPEDIRAHITGTVWKIEVAIGEEVEEDEDLIILESMKMEMPISAPFDGIVREILIAEGDSVDEDQVLIRFERV